MTLYYVQTQNNTKSMKTTIVAEAEDGKSFDDTVTRDRNTLDRRVVRWSDGFLAQASSRNHRFFSWLEFCSR